LTSNASRNVSDIFAIDANWNISTVVASLVACAISTIRAIHTIRAIRTIRAISAIRAISTIRAIRTVRAVRTRKSLVRAIGAVNTICCI